jgi:Holliday junction resolvase-like predicted endonuclease
MKSLKVFLFKLFKSQFYNITGIRFSHRAIVGHLGEIIALRKLRRDYNFILWERNWHYRKGELDLIGRIERTLVIVEVKTRMKSTENGTFINYTDLKHSKVRLLADHYFAASRVRQSRERIRCRRIDLIAIEIVNHYGIWPKCHTLIHFEDIGEGVAT